MIAFPHGSMAIAGGLVMGAILAGGPKNLMFRSSCFVVLAAVTATAPAPAARESYNVSLIGLVGLFIMLAMITEVPGRRKQWSRFPWFRRLLTEEGLDGRSYYKRAELRGNLKGVKPGRVLYAVHPHGVLTAGWTWNMFFNGDFHKRCGRVGFLLDEGLRLKSPTFRMMCDWVATDEQWAGPATKRVMLESMAKGKSSLALLPGGFQEATLCEKGKDRVYIKNRAGFVKYCLMHGYSIVPVYTFGESDTYSCFSWLLKPRLALAKRNVPAAAMWGVSWCPFLPRPAELLTYIGDEIKLPKIADPAKDDIKKYHGLYMKALQALFDKHKADAGRPDAKLEMY
jgi:2-acylglycerol O-acyltransferase 2